MQRPIQLSFPEAQALVELLENADDSGLIHNKSYDEFAAEIRAEFQMPTREQERLAWLESHKNDPKIDVGIAPQIYSGDFGCVSIASSNFSD